MKKVKEWLSYLPLSIRTKAMTNLCSIKEDKEVSSLEMALCHAFTWSETPEGLTYWQAVHSRALGGGFDTCTCSKAYEALDEIKSVVLSRSSNEGKEKKILEIIEGTLKEVE